MICNRESGTLDALLPIEEIKERLGIRQVRQELLGNYHTVGGFVLASLGRIPRKAERFTWAEWEFELVDVDRNRVDQVLATRASKKAGVGAKRAGRGALKQADGPFLIPAALGFTAR